MLRLRWPAFIVLMLLSVALIAACGDDDDDDDDDATATATATATAADADDHEDEGGAVDVSLSEWAVEPAASSVDHGEVTFNTANSGSAPHNLWVIRTDLGVEDLPTDAGIVPEGEVDVVAKSEDLEAGTTTQLTADLEAGSYVLICNIAGHYDLGMRVAFTVN